MGMPYHPQAKLAEKSCFCSASLNRVRRFAVLAFAKMGMPYHPQAKLAKTSGFCSASLNRIRRFAVLAFAKMGMPYHPQAKLAQTSGFCSASLNRIRRFAVLAFTKMGMPHHPQAKLAEKSCFCSFSLDKRSFLHYHSSTLKYYVARKGAARLGSFRAGHWFFMRTYSKITPEGARDLLFEECRARREVQAKLSQVFTLRGYREVITPGLEYFDVFNLPGAAIPQQEMYKCTDNHGRLVVFRPDSTLPIARMAASRLQGWERPLRFFYSQTIYRNRPDLSGRSDESAQMGIELMGAGGLRADLEAIATAVEALSACVPDFRVEIGHARFFQALADQLPLSPEEKEGLRDTIESKNYAALSERLDPLGDLPAARAMAQLPRLFGGEEALAGAERWFQDGETRDILESLKGLYQALGQLGLGDRLMVDLGLVQRNDYYTGVVFSAYVPQRGDAVLLGGRYDGLCGKFGDPMPAVGFSIDLDAVADLNTALAGPAPVEALVYGEPGFEMQGQKLVSSLAGQGVLCESSLFETEAETLEYAKKRNIPTVYVVGENTREITLEGGKR